MSQVKQHNLLNEAHDDETLRAQAHHCHDGNSKLFIMTKGRMHGGQCQACDQKRTWRNKASWSALLVLSVLRQWENSTGF